MAKIDANINKNLEIKDEDALNQELVLPEVANQDEIALKNQNDVNNEAINEVAKVQNTLANDGSLEDLEATAAGGGDVGGGTSLSAASFASGGHESSVSANSSLYNGYVDTSANANFAPTSGGSNPIVVTISELEIISTDTDSIGDGVADKTIVTGKTNPGANISIFDGENLIGEGIAKADGTFEIELNRPLNQGESVRVVSELGGGRAEESISVENVVITDDRAEPVNITELILNDDSENADNVAERATLKGVAEANSTLEILHNGNVVGTGLTDNQGNFIINLNGEFRSGDEFRVVATDMFGHKASDSVVATLDNMQYVDDTTTVNITEAFSVDENEVADGNVDKTIVRGTGEVGASIELFDENQTSIGTTTVQNDGTWEIELSNPLQPGANITATATDIIGNTASANGQVVGDIVYSDQSIQVELQRAVALDTDNVADGIANTTLLEGVTEAGATLVFYNSNNEVVARGTADSDGRFSIRSDVVVNVGEDVRVVATDKAGNEAESSLTVSGMAYPNDTEATLEVTLAKSIDTSANADNVPDRTIITGRGEPGASITILDSENSPVGTTTVRPDGTFDVETTRPFNVGDVLNVKETDLAGNETTSPIRVSQLEHTDNSTFGTIDTIVITDTDNPADGITNTIKLVGTGEPNAGVRFYKGDTLIGEGSVDNQGRYDLTFNRTDISAGDTIRAVFTDIINNSFEASNVVPELTFTDRAVDFDNIVITTTDTSANADSTPEESKVTGHTEPGATVVLKDNQNNIIGQATAGADGNFEIDTTRPVNVGENINIEITDKAGNTTTQTINPTELRHTDSSTYGTLDRVIPIDTDSPADGVGNQIKLIGTGEPGASIVFKGPNNEVIGQGVVNSDGNYEVVLNHSVNPGQQITAEFTDIVGNTTSASKNAESLTFTDTDIQVQINSVVSNDTDNPADGVSNEVILNISTEAGANVVIKKGSEVLFSGQANEQGVLVATITQTAGSKFLNPNDGVTVTATDKAGNSADATGIIPATTFTNDTDITLNVDSVRTIDTSDIADNTPERSIISGRTEGGANVVIKDANNNVVGEITANDDGSFTIQTTRPLNPNENITITATDKAGNTTSQTVQVPALEHTDDSTTGTIDSVVLTDTSAVADRVADSIQISGTGEPGARVVFKTGDTVIGEGTVLPNGTYSLTFALNDANRVNPNTPITATFTDTANNTHVANGNSGDLRFTDNSINLNVTLAKTIDTDSPADGVSNKGQVSGNTEAGAKVEIYIGDSKIGEGFAGNDGSFNIETSAIPANTEITVTATDKAGNSTTQNANVGSLDFTDRDISINVTETISKDSSTPADGVVDRTTINGNTEPGARVEIIKDGSVIGTGTAGDDGRFSINTNTPLPANTEVTVRATDKAGNQAEQNVNTANTTYDDTSNSITLVSATPIDTDSPADGIVNTSRIVFNTEPNATVVLTYLNKDTHQTDTATLRANSTGEVVFNVPADKGSAFEAVSTDIAGNRAQTNGNLPNTITFSNDTGTNVDITSANPVDENRPADGVADKVKVVGTAEAGARVDIYHNNEKIGSTTANAQGQFEVVTSKAVPSGESVRAVATDKAGHTAQDTEVVSNNTLYLDDSTEVSVVSAIPVDTNSIADGVADVARITLRGEVGATLSVTNSSNTPIWTGTVPSEGTVTFDANALKAGDNFLVSARDIAGNTATTTGTVSSTISYDDNTNPTFTDLSVKVIDTNNPADGVVDRVELGGVTEPNAKVEFFDSDETKIGETTADASGRFTVTFDTDLVQPKETVHFKVTDTAGNTGDAHQSAGNINFTAGAEIPPEVLTALTNAIDIYNSPKIADLSSISFRTGSFDSAGKNSVTKFSVTGQTAKNADVFLYDNENNYLGKARSNDSGWFNQTIDSDKVFKGEEVKVVVNDGGSIYANKVVATDQFVDNKAGLYNIKILQVFYDETHQTFDYQATFTKDNDIVSDSIKYGKLSDNSLAPTYGETSNIRPEDFDKLFIEASDKYGNTTRYFLKDIPQDKRYWIEKFDLEIKLKDVVNEKYDFGIEKYIFKNVNKSENLEFGMVESMGYLGGVKQVDEHTHEWGSKNTPVAQREASSDEAFRGYLKYDVNVGDINTKIEDRMGIAKPDVEVYLKDKNGEYSKVYLGGAIDKPLETSKHLYKSVTINAEDKIDRWVNIVEYKTIKGDDGFIKFAALVIDTPKNSQLEFYRQDGTLIKKSGLTALKGNDTIYFSREDNLHNGETIKVVSVGETGNAPETLGILNANYTMKTPTLDGLSFNVVVNNPFSKDTYASKLNNIVVNFSSEKNIGKIELKIIDIETNTPIYGKNISTIDGSGNSIPGLSYLSHGHGYNSIFTKNPSNKLGNNEIGFNTNIDLRSSSIKIKGDYPTEEELSKYKVSLVLKTDDGHVISNEEKTLDELMKSPKTVRDILVQDTIIPVVTEELTSMYFDEVSNKYNLELKLDVRLPDAVRERGYTIKDILNMHHNDEAVNLLISEGEQDKISQSLDLDLNNKDPYSKVTTKGKKYIYKSDLTSNDYDEATDTFSYVLNIETSDIDFFRANMTYNVNFYNHGRHIDGIWKHSVTSGSTGNKNISPEILKEQEISSEKLIGMEDGLDSAHATEDNDKSKIQLQFKAREGDLKVYNEKGDLIHQETLTKQNGALQVRNLTLLGQDFNQKLKLVIQKGETSKEVFVEVPKISHDAQSYSYQSYEKEDRTKLDKTVGEYKKASVIDFKELSHNGKTPVSKLVLNLTEDGLENVKHAVVKIDGKTIADLNLAKEGAAKSIIEVPIDLTKLTSENKGVHLVEVNYDHTGSVLISNMENIKHYVEVGFAKDGGKPVYLGNDDKIQGIDAKDSAYALEKLSEVYKQANGDTQNLTIANKDMYNIYETANSVNSQVEKFLTSTHKGNDMLDDTATINSSELYSDDSGLNSVSFKNDGTNHNLTIEGSKDIYVKGGNATDTITDNNDGFTYINSGSGDDSINLNKVNSIVEAGDGNDVINLNLSSLSDERVGKETSTSPSTDTAISIDGNLGRDVLNIGGKNEIDFDKMSKTYGDSIKNVEEIHLNNDVTKLTLNEDILKDNNGVKISGQAGDQVQIKTNAQTPEFNKVENATEGYHKYQNADSQYFEIKEDLTLNFIH